MKNARSSTSTDPEVERFLDELEHPLQAILREWIGQL